LAHDALEVGGGRQHQEVVALGHLDELGDRCLLGKAAR
jgi:hypothetical protein